MKDKFGSWWWRQHNTKCLFSHTKRAFLSQDHVLWFHSHLFWLMFSLSHLICQHKTSAFWASLLWKPQRLLELLLCWHLEAAARFQKIKNDDHPDHPASLHGPIPADWIRGHVELAYASIPPPHIDSDSGVLETSFPLSWNGLGAQFSQTT